MVFGGTRRRGLNNTPMSEDDNPFQTRGRSAEGEEGVSYSHVRGRQLMSSFEHAEQMERACLNTTRALMECLVSHTNAFLLGAKGSENGKGLFSESAPCNPKTPHTPTNEKRARREHSPPYLRGQREIVSKRRN